MKVKQNLFPALLVALALTACNTEEETMQGADGRIALQVTSGIQTRAYDNQWETGDRIGIYAFGKGTTTVARRLWQYPLYHGVRRYHRLICTGWNHHLPAYGRHGTRFRGVLSLHGRSD